MGRRGAWLRIVILSLSVSPILLFSPSTLAANHQVDYLTRIKPLLRQRCYACHGALKQEGELRLDTMTSMLKGGESGPVIERKMAEDSLLLQRISALDPSERMPPEHEGEPLTDQQIAWIRRWILAGAPAPADERPESDPTEHWAFQPIIRPEVPASNSVWMKNPIDTFLEKEHRTHNLNPQPEAPRIVLLRRLHLDLLGIPPRADEITAFESDPSGHSYDDAVERLLDDPRHGERWARHWMDIWRYSDWWGLGKQLRNSQRHIWHWRDWIVESINNDTPYDEMVRLMLAADELHPNDLSKLRATGYLARNYFLFNRPQWMKETVEHVSKGFLGLTMNCARCHDHKFDPLEQEDFYRMRAFFEPYHVRLDVVPGEPDLEKDGIPRVFDGMLDTPTWLYIRGDERNPDKSAAIAPGVPAVLAFAEPEIVPVSLPDDAWRPEKRPWVFAAHMASAAKRLEFARSELTKARAVLSEATDDRKTSGRSESPSTAGTSADNAQLKLSVADAAVALAEAESDSIRKRAEARKAVWDGTGRADQDKITAAVRAERTAREAKERHGVAVAELAFQQATSDTKKTAEQALTKARNALKQAVTDKATEIKPTDRFTPLPGAIWTSTRFLDSTKDDPKIEFPSTSSGRRTALANWITDHHNPLTARVAANHIWTRHMGQPLVSTVFDFGRNGTPPTHPELLDWLAVELIDSGWSMKHLHRLIVNSAAYRMSSTMAGSEDCVSKDPENRFLWRRVPIRLESQAVRDSLLALAGTLDTAMGGPPVSPNHQAASPRRSLYLFHSNNERDLFLTMFDEALVKDCYRREQSVVPQQALALTNSKLVLDASERIATRMSEDNAEEAPFIRTAFRVIVGINPSDAEMAASAKAISNWQTLAGESSENARAKFVWALINHNDFVTLR